MVRSGLTTHISLEFFSNWGYVCLRHSLRSATYPYQAPTYPCQARHSTAFWSFHSNLLCTKSRSRPETWKRWIPTTINSDRMAEKVHLPQLFQWYAQLGIRFRDLCGQNWALRHNIHSDIILKNNIMSGHSFFGGLLYGELLKKWERNMKVVRYRVFERIGQ